MALMFALAVGVAFGFTLERAGLGTAPKLAGQFYLADFTVMKVMFTAIVVAMTGAFWLARLGAIDLEGLAVPETFLLPQLAGGAIFGAFISAAAAGRLRRGVDRGPRISVKARLACAFGGGAAMGIGAALARGCTSGLALSGGALLSVGSWAFMFAAFAIGFACAPLMRWAWR